MRALGLTNLYLWKCWRDTRHTFIVLVSTLLTVAAYSAFVQLDPFGWFAAMAEPKRVAWQFSRGFFVTMMVGLTPVFGFALGSLGVGTEFEKRTVEFLLTRPRARAYFLWTSWGLGAAQMVALVALGNVINRLAGTAYLDPVHSANALRIVAGLSATALLLYSATFLMTTLTGKSRHGQSLGLGIFIAYMFLYAWLGSHDELRVPSFMELVFSSGRAADFPLSAVLGWLLVSLAMVLAAQFSFERAEI